MLHWDISTKKYITSKAHATKKRRLLGGGAQSNKAMTQKNISNTESDGGENSQSGNANMASEFMDDAGGVGKEIGGVTPVIQKVAAIAIEANANQMIQKQIAKVMGDVTDISKDTTDKMFANLQQSVVISLSAFPPFALMFDLINFGKGVMDLANAGVKAGMVSVNAYQTIVQILKAAAMKHHDIDGTEYNDEALLKMGIHPVDITPGADNEDTSHKESAAESEEKEPSEEKEQSEDKGSAPSDEAGSAPTAQDDEAESKSSAPPDESSEQPSASNKQSETKSSSRQTPVSEAPPSNRQTEPRSSAIASASKDQPVAAPKSLLAFGMPLSGGGGSVPSGELQTRSTVLTGKTSEAAKLSDIPRISSSKLNPNPNPSTLSSNTSARKSNITSIAPTEKITFGLPLVGGKRRKTTRKQVRRHPKAKAKARSQRRRA